MEPMCAGSLCPFSQISWLWYAASVLISFGVGMLWYGKLFSRKWIEAVRYNCPCGADLTKGQTCTCKSSNYWYVFFLQFVAIAILALMYFVLSPISIYLSLLVVVAVSGWIKAMFRFQIPETKRWISLCTIDVGYFFVISVIMIGLALV